MSLKKSFSVIAAARRFFFIAAFSAVSIGGFFVSAPQVQASTISCSLFGLWCNSEPTNPSVLKVDPKPASTPIPLDVSACTSGGILAYHDMFRELGCNAPIPPKNANPVAGSTVNSSGECWNAHGICGAMGSPQSDPGQYGGYSLIGVCNNDNCSLKRTGHGQWQSDCYCYAGPPSSAAPNNTSSSSTYTTSQSPSPQNNASFISSRTSGVNRAGMTSAECRNAGGSACYSADGSEASDAARFEYKGDCQDNRICLAERTNDPTLTFEQTTDLENTRPISRSRSLKPSNLLNDDGCKSLYGKDTAACLTPDADAKGMYDTEKKCQTASGSEGTCFATKFSMGVTDEGTWQNIIRGTAVNTKCLEQNGRCVGSIVNGCTDASWSVPIGVCSQVRGDNTMCCKQATDGNSCQGGGLICKQSNGETDDAAVCTTGGLVLDTSGKTCPSGNPKQVCCVNKEIQDQAIVSNPLPAFAATAVPLENPLQYESIPEALQGILNALRGVVVVLALVFLIIGALLYIVSGGDEGRIKTAKLAITAALIGLAIAIAAPAFLNEISSVLGWSAPDSELSGALTLSAILMNTLNFLLSIIGIAALIMLIIGALSYLSSGGDDKRIDSAKGIVKYSLIGIAVAFGSLIVIKQIVGFFE